MHKLIFFAVCACLIVAIAVAASAAGRDEAMHRAYYEEYQAANALFADKQFEEPYKTYERLSAIYDDSYILQLKMMVCAMNMGMWEEAVEHGRRTLELYPQFAKDEDFMDGLSHSLKQLGDKDEADRLEEYYYGFARKQK